MLLPNEALGVAEAPKQSDKTKAHGKMKNAGSLSNAILVVQILGRGQDSMYSISMRQDDIYYIGSVLQSQLPYQQGSDKAFEGYQLRDFPI